MRGYRRARLAAGMEEELYRRVWRAAADEEVEEIGWGGDDCRDDE